MTITRKQRVIIDFIEKEINVYFRGTDSDSAQRFIEENFDLALEDAVFSGKTEEVDRMRYVYYNGDDEDEVI